MQELLFFLCKYIIPVATCLLLVLPSDCDDAGTRKLRLVLCGVFLTLIGWGFEDIQSGVSSGSKEGIASGGGFAIFIVITFGIVVMTYRAVRVMVFALSWMMIFAGSAIGLILLVLCIIWWVFVVCIGQVALLVIWIANLLALLFGLSLWDDFGSSDYGSTTSKVPPPSPTPAPVCHTEVKNIKEGDNIVIHKEEKKNVVVHNEYNCFFDNIKCALVFLLISLAMLFLAYFTTFEWHLTVVSEVCVGLYALALLAAFLFVMAGTKDPFSSAKKCDFEDAPVRWIFGGAGFLALLCLVFFDWHGKSLIGSPISYSQRLCCKIGSFFSPKGEALERLFCPADDSESRQMSDCRYELHNLQDLENIKEYGLRRRGWGSLIAGTRATFKDLHTVGIPLSRRDGNGMTLLMTAAACGDAESVEAMLKDISYTELNMISRYKGVERTALDWAKNNRIRNMLKLAGAVPAPKQ